MTPTPRAIVDLDVLERNAAAMTARADTLGVALRPHVKTHKCVEAARIQCGGDTGPITVSTLAETRRFADAGFRDITYAFPFPIDRIEEAADLADRIDRLSLLVDQTETAGALQSFARARGIRFDVLLEVDCGDHRAGVDPGSAGGLDLAKSVARASRLELRGVLTHAGHAYACRSRDEVRSVAAEERDAVAGFADRLRSDGIEIETVSVGSTPTACAAGDLTGVTEIRPGNYAFFDVFQAAIGSCTLEDVAFSVEATVVGRYPSRSEVVVDAGALALSKDPGPTHVDPACGYGVVAGREDLRVVSLSQEHGIVRGPGAADLSVGERVRILPNHSCLAAACHAMFEVRRGAEPVGEWSPVRGW